MGSRKVIFIVLSFIAALAILVAAAIYAFPKFDNDYNRAKAWIQDQSFIQLAAGNITDVKLVSLKWNGTAHRSDGSAQKGYKYYVFRVVGDKAEITTHVMLVDGDSEFQFLRGDVKSLELDPQA